MAGKGRPRTFDRTEALRLAMELFWRYGYEGTSVADLTTAMGITAPSLYNAFHSKEALFREAVEYYVDNDGNTTERALREQPCARAAIETMLRRAGDISSDADAPRGCLVVLGATNCTLDNQKIDDLLRRYRLATQDAIRLRIEKGVAEGELPPHTDARALAGFYTTVLNGLAIQSRDGETQEGLDAVVQTAMQAWPA